MAVPGRRDKDNHHNRKAHCVSAITIIAMIYCMVQSQRDRGREGDRLGYRWLTPLCLSVWLQCKMTPDVLGMTDMLLQTPEAGLRTLLHAKSGEWTAAGLVEDWVGVLARVRQLQFCVVLQLAIRSLQESQFSKPLIHFYDSPLDVTAKPKCASSLRSPAKLVRPLPDVSPLSRLPFDSPLAWHH